MTLQEITYDKSFIITDNFEGFEVNGQVTYGRNGGIDIMLSLVNPSEGIKGDYAYSLSDDGFLSIRYTIPIKFKDIVLEYAERITNELIDSKQQWDIS